MFISSPFQKNSPFPFYSQRQSVTFGAKPALYKAAESENPEKAIDKLIKRSKSPQALRKRINKRTSVSYNGANYLTEQPLHRLLRNPRVTKRAVEQLVSRGAELHPDLIVRNKYAIVGYPYTTFLETVNRHRSLKKLKSLFEEDDASPADLVKESSKLANEAEVNAFLMQQGAETSETRFLPSAERDSIRNVLQKALHIVNIKAVVNQCNPRALYAMMKHFPKVRISSTDPIEEPIPYRLSEPDVISTLYASFPRRKRTQKDHMQEFRKLIQELIAYDYIGGDKQRYRDASSDYDFSNWLKAWHSYIREELPESKKPPLVFDDPSVAHRAKTGQMLSEITDEILAQLPEPKKTKKKKIDVFQAVSQDCY
jgi:hypothetical protein